MKQKLRIIQTLALVCICGFGTGCNRRSYEWRADRRPETAEERTAVELETTAILAATPITKLEGHDQDWDDAIRMAHECAVQTHCKTRLYEWVCIGFPDGSQRETGRVKAVNE